jgi:hypothetical protein
MSFFPPVTKPAARVPPLPYRLAYAVHVGRSADSKFQPGRIGCRWRAVPWQRYCCRFAPARSGRVSSLYRGHIIIASGQGWRGRLIPQRSPDDVT